MAAVRGVAGVMSKVISFRMNPENPREAEALSILYDWLSQGFSTRHTLTEALLILDSGKSQSLDNGTLAYLTNQIQEFLVNVETGSAYKTKNNEISPKQELSAGFVSSIIKAAKPGIKANT